MTIQSFDDKAPEVFFWTGRTSKGVGWSSITPIVRRKLDMLHYAHILKDLESPPGNRLEALKGKLSGFFSIGVNNQWRIIFRWSEQGPYDVSVVDYH